MPETARNLGAGPGWALWKALLVASSCVDTDREPSAANFRVVGEVLADHERLG